MCTLSGNKKITQLHFTPDELFQVIACVCACEREILGELMLNHQTKVTLPKSSADPLGNVFVPMGILERHVDHKLQIKGPEHRSDKAQPQVPKRPPRCLQNIF